MHPDIPLFIKSINKAGIAANLSPRLPDQKAITCYYKNNPDGSIRWIWPSASKKTDFLRFYHVSGFRSEMMALYIKTLAKKGWLKRLSDGEFTFFVNGETYAMVKHEWQSRWAWFSGTIGPNRKSILWRQAANQNSGLFIKIPLTDWATINLAVEKKQIKALKAMGFQNVVIPETEEAGESCLQLSDIGINTSRTNNFKELPFAAVKEWMQAGIQIEKYTGSAFAKKMDDLFAELKDFQDERFPKNFVEKLIFLKNNSILDETVIVTTVAHGDFTPWNIFVKNDRLHCIDFELSGNQMPALFDLFHFVYQSNILIGNNGYKTIRYQLDYLFNLPEWQAFIKEHQIDVDAAEKLYLLYIITYYTGIYHYQPQWHTQVSWLLKTWEDAIDHQFQKSAPGPSRKLLLNELGLMLENKKHAILKWMYEGIDTLPNAADMDICMSSRDAKQLIEQLRSNRLVAKIAVKKRSFMTQLELLLTDGDLLYLDLINTFKRKSVIFLDASKILTNAKKNKYGLMVPDPADDFAYTWLFYWLNDSDMPDRYQFFFHDFNKADETKLNALLYNHYTLPVFDYRDVFYRDKSLNAKLLQNLSLRKENKGARRLLNRLVYCFDTLRNLFPQKGVIITFSGVDGAGKSTVIENVRKLIDKQLRKKIVVLRHRPGILPILSTWKHGKQHAEALAAQNLPRQGKNNNKLSSLARFCYYYIDYLIGQWYVYFRYVMLGYVVLYDRYYFDFINDARRSNIDIPPAFIKWLYRFLLKPRLNFFLYADPKVILQRKQELDAPTIRQLTGNYLSLFNSLKTRSKKAIYLPLENNLLADSLDFVFKQIKKLSYEGIN